MRPAYLRSTISRMSTSLALGSKGRLTSFTVPTVTPLIFTGLPSARPETLSSRTRYSFLREKIFSSLPMAKRKIISTAMATATSMPTRRVRSLEVVAMVWILVLSVRLGRGDGRGAEELAQHGMIAVAALFHRPDPLEHAFVQKRDAV